jgi:regulator of sigma E protease
MQSFFITLLSFLVALGVLITVHEFGHFWVARKLGVKVLRFSIGFGRPLWQRVGKVDGTEYVVAAIPLGGYVKMLDEREGEVAPEEWPRAFNRQTLGRRAAIVVAGPLFNLLFAVVAYWAILVVGDSGLRPVIGTVSEGSIAAGAGFRGGDEILAVAQRPTPTWEAALFAFLAGVLDGEDLPVKVREANGGDVTRWLEARVLAGLPEDPAVLGQIGLSPARPSLPPVVGEVVAGEPAAAAGLRSGDRILAVNGEPIQTWQRWVERVRASPEQVLRVEVEREGNRLDLRIEPRSVTQGPEHIGRIGAGVFIPEGHDEQYRTLVRLGPVDALGEAVRKTLEMSRLMLRVLGRMLIGEASVQNLSGPISIAESAGKSASNGPGYFVKFLAVVSISLGILNLLPIPVLDGGHLLFLLIEAVKGSPLSEWAQLQGQRVGMALLLALMGLALYVDLGRLLG